MKQNLDIDFPPGSGIIMLYDWNDECIKGMKYKGKKNRKEIIDMWRRQYAANFNRCYYQIAPALRPERVDKDGLNTVSPYNPRKKTKSIGSVGYKINVGKNANKFYE